MAPLDFCAKRYQNRVNVCVCVDVFEIFFCLMCVFAVCGLSYVSASPQCFVSLHIFVLTVCVALFVKLDVCKWVCIFYARFSFVLVSLYVNIWKCWCVCVCVCICPCVPVKVLVCVHSAVVVHVFVFWEKMGKGERWWFACVFVGAYVCVCVHVHCVPTTIQIHVLFSPTSTVAANVQAHDWLPHPSERERERGFTVFSWLGKMSITASLQTGLIITKTHTHMHTHLYFTLLP